MSAEATGGDFHPELPCHLGDYELLEEIGRGGMGVIYKARQCCLDRLCAVKMLRPGLGSNGPEAEAALRAEAAVAAQLDHPNIVGIFEVGRERGQLFFSMEFVPGEDIGRYVRARVMDAAGIARLMKAVAEAISYAHARGVMHHDLKPANVVVDPDGQPQITDFGLARRVDAAHRADPTRGAGSPNFLAPEQASARFGEPGFHTDVFGLGAILYYLLTDRAPFVGVTAEDTVRAAIETDPIEPRALRRGVAVDLAVICMKCLQKAPQRRYGSAREVADELGRFLNDEPIRARPVSGLERGRRLCRRHPVIAGLATTVALLLVVLALGASVAALRIDEARQRAETSERMARRQLYNADLLLASAAYAEGHDGQVRRILEAHGRTGGVARPGWEWRFLRHASQGDMEGVLGRQTSTVLRLEATRDGRHVVAADTSGALSVWEVATRSRVGLRTLAPVGAPLFALAPRTDRVLSVRRSVTDSNDVAVVLGLPGLEVERELPLVGRHVAGAFTVGEDAVWLMGAEWVARVPMVAGGLELRYAVKRARRAIDFAFSGDGRWLAFVQADDRLGLLELGTGELVASLEGHEANPIWGASIQSMRFSADSRWLATAGSDGTVRLWDVVRARLRETLVGHADLVTDVAFAPDGGSVVSSGRDGFLQLSRLGADGGKLETWRLRGADPVQTAVSVLPGEGIPVSAGVDGVLRRWHREPQDRVPVLTNLPTPTADLEPLADGEHFLVHVGNQGLRVARLSDGQVVESWEPDEGRLASTMERAPGGRFHRASVVPPGHLEVGVLEEEGWRVVGAVALRRSVTARRTMDLRFSEDVRWLACSDVVNGVEIFSVSNLVSVRVVEGHPVRMGFSPSGRRLAVGEPDGSIRLIDLGGGEGGERRWMHPQHFGFGFSAGEDRMASVGLDGTVRLWDVGTGEELARLQSSLSHLLPVCWSPEGDRLFVASLNGELSVWDLGTLRETFQMRLHGQPVTALQWTEDGSVRSFAPDGIRTWRAPEP